MNSFHLFTEFKGYKKKDVISNNRTTKLVVLSTYRIWWKQILLFFGLNLYKAPYIYKVKVLTES